MSSTCGGVGRLAISLVVVVGASAGVVLRVAAQTPAPPAVQRAYSDDVQRRLEAAATRLVETFAYRRLGSPFYGALDDDSTASHTLVVSDTGRTTLWVACDRDCDDVELAVFDDAGAEVTPRDEIQEEGVSFRARRPGTYRVVVLMKSCKANPCYYGVQAFTP